MLNNIQYYYLQYTYIGALVLTLIIIMKLSGHYASQCKTKLAQGNTN